MKFGHLSNLNKCSLRFIFFSSSALKLINIRWIRTSSQLKKSCLALIYRQFSTNDKIKIIKIPVLLSRAYNIDYILRIFQFNICKNLSIIRCDKDLLIISETVVIPKHTSRHKNHKISLNH